MTKAERKLRLARRILSSDDEKFLAEIEKLEKKYVFDFEAKSAKELTVEELMFRIKKSEKEFENGNYHYVDDLLNQY
jgi:hypothetical protein